MMNSYTSSTACPLSGRGNRGRDYRVYSPYIYYTLLRVWLKMRMLLQLQNLKLLSAIWEFKISFVRKTDTSSASAFLRDIFETNSERLGTKALPNRNEDKS